MKKSILLLCCIAINFSVFSQISTVSKAPFEAAVASRSALPQNLNGRASFNFNNQAKFVADDNNTPSCTGAPSNISIQVFKVYPYPDLPKSKVIFTVTNLPDVTYSWYIDGQLVSSGGTSGRSFEFPNSEEHYIEVEAVNPCGVSNRLGEWKLVNE